MSTSVQNKKTDNCNIVQYTPGCLLVDKQIIDLCSKGYLISTKYDIKNVESVSYNLTVKDVVIWQVCDSPRDPNLIQNEDIMLTYASSKKIPPRGMAFVRAEERLRIPDNIVGKIVERNSLIRTGLFVSGPQYQPGHETAIYLRVYNMTDYDIEIKQGQSIAQICFEVLAEVPSETYGQSENDRYKDEDAFAVPYTYITNHIKDTSELEKKMDSLEARMYTIFATFIGAFVSVLSLLTINFKIMCGKSLIEIVIINASLAFCIVVILGMVFVFCKMLTMPKRKHKNRK